MPETRPGTTDHADMDPPGGPGTVYLLHFDRPYEHAGHYLGWASPGHLTTRLADHAAGRGARLMEVITAAGIGFHLARTWPGTRTRERQLKNQGGASRCCPDCGVTPRTAHAPGQQAVKENTMDHDQTAQTSQADQDPLDRAALRDRLRGLTGDQVNDQLQQSASPAAARAILAAATAAQLHQVADLNYVDHQRSRTGITRDLLTARYPADQDHQTSAEVAEQDPAEFAHGAYPTPWAALPEDLTRLPDHLTGRAEQAEQGDEAEQADMADRTWTEYALQQDGTWLHTKTVTYQVPAADVHAWSDQDDDQLGASGYDATNEAWLDAIGLEDEL